MTDRKYGSSELSETQQLSEEFYRRCNGVLGRPTRTCSKSTAWSARSRWASSPSSRQQSTAS